MDIDRFIREHENDWAELEALVRRAGARGGGLDPAAVRRLVELYRIVSTHLSLARGRLADPALAQRLTTLVGRAGAVIYGSRPPSWRAVGRFFTTTFPAALWHLRRLVAVATAALLVPAVIMGAWIGTSDRALDVAAPEALREAYVSEDFEAYYSSQPSAQFASQVTTNNIQVGLLAFASGILLAVPTLAVLAFNGANVGVAAGLFVAAGQAPRFWGLILPHGLLELTAVFVAGGTGIALGWAVISPGDKRRSVAVAEEGRRAVVVVLGLALMFVVSGIIEGFVTGSALPTWARVGVGVVVEVAFLTYAALFGSRAAERGLTGAVGEQADVGWSSPSETATFG